MYAALTYAGRLSYYVQAEQDIKDFFDISHWHWGGDSTSTPAKMPTLQLADFMSHFGKWGNMKPLLACSHASLGVNVSETLIDPARDSYSCCRSRSTASP